MFELVYQFIKKLNKFEERKKKKKEIERKESNK
ncbi:hypothetical protein [Spiroplasma phoeniceum]